MDKVERVLEKLAKKEKDHSSSIAAGLAGGTFGMLGTGAHAGVSAPEGEGIKRFGGQILGGIAGGVPAGLLAAMATKGKLGPTIAASSAGHGLGAGIAHSKMKESYNDKIKTATLNLSKKLI